MLISWLHDAPILRRCIIESIHRRTGRETLSEAQKKNTEGERVSERERRREGEEKRDVYLKFFLVSGKFMARHIERNLNYACECARCEMHTERVRGRERERVRERGGERREKSAARTGAAFSLKSVLALASSAGARVMKCSPHCAFSNFVYA